MQNIEERLAIAYKEYAEDVECDVSEVPEILRRDWGQGGDRGYAIFTCSDTDVLHIERIDELMIYDSDREAAEQAEKDGIKLIHDISIPKDSVLWGYERTFIDTPENREQLRKELKNEHIR